MEENCAEQLYETEIMQWGREGLSCALPSGLVVRAYTWEVALDSFILSCPVAHPHGKRGRDPPSCWTPGWVVKALCWEVGDESSNPTGCVGTGLSIPPLGQVPQLVSY